MSDPLTREENRRRHLEAQARKEADRLARKAEQDAERERERNAKREAARQANAADREMRMRPKEAEIPTPPPTTVAGPGRINNVLTHDVIDALCDQRRQCMPSESAAARCRVPVEYLYAWIAQGRRDVSAGEATIYADLALSLDQAGADAEATLIGYVRGGDNWQSAKFLLEQLNAAAYGKSVQTVDVNVRSASIVVTEDVRAMSQEEKQAMFEAARKRVAMTSGRQRAIEAEPDAD